MTEVPSARKLNPDRLAALEEERDFLLASLEDLENEHEVGDLDDADYRQLKDDYTVRTADALRAIDDHHAQLDAATSSPRRGARLGWLLGLTLFALGAGYLLAQAAGERGLNDGLTGSIEESVREQVLRCQQMGTDPARLLDSLECFDEVLNEDPQNVTALTYRGWYVVLASGNAQQAGQNDAAADLLASGQLFLDRAVGVDPTFPDARAFRAIVYDRQGEADLACGEIGELMASGPPPMILQLVTPLADRLACG